MLAGKHHIRMSAPRPMLVPRPHISLRSLPIDVASVKPETDDIANVGVTVYVDSL